MGNQLKLPTLPWSSRKERSSSIGLVEALKHVLNNGTIKEGKPEQTEKTRANELGVSIQ